MRNREIVLSSVVLACVAASALFGDLDSVRHWGNIDGPAKGVTTKYLRHDFQSNDKQKFLYQRFLSYDDGVHRPTFSIIDVSYDDYPSADTVYEPMANEDKKSSNTFAGESEPVTPPPTLVTLPIFVIGFSGTIVICGLFMLYSEFRARRKFDKDVIMLIQSLSSNSSIAFSNGRSSQSSSAISPDPQNSKRTLDSMFGSVYADGDSCTRESEKDNYVPIIPVCICDNSTENLSSLYYDVNHPEQFYCAKAAKAAVAAWKGQNRNSKNHPDRIFLGDNRDWEILFYRSEDSTSMSVASTITKSLSQDCQTKNVDSLSQCNEIMELTEIHRVSTGITIESLVELGTISASTASFAKPSSLCSATPLHTAEQQDTTEVNLDDDQNYESDDDQAAKETKNDAHFQIESRRASLPAYPSVRKCSISDFDAGTPQIVEVMTREDCISADGSDNIELVNIRDETGVEDKDETEERNNYSSRASEESSFVVVGGVDDAASSKVSSSASCSDDIDSQVTEVNSIGSLNTVWIETLKPPPSTLVLDEGSLIEVAKRNGYTRMENEHVITQVEEDEKPDDIEASGKRRVCDEYFDCIRSLSSSSSSSSSMDASKITNCKNQEDRTFGEEHDCGFESRVEP